jgi:hypothetical protein
MLLSIFAAFVYNFTYPEHKRLLRAVSRVRRPGYLGCYCPDSEGRRGHTHWLGCDAEDEEEADVPVSVARQQGTAARRRECLFFQWRNLSI